MPAGTNLKSRFVALGDSDGNFEEILTGTLPASSPLTYTSALRSVEAVVFAGDATAAPLTGNAYQVATGNAVTVHLDSAQFSRAFTLRLVGKR
jgi:hypothetical protein